MRWLSRSRSGAPDPSRADGLDDDVWQILTEVITAVHGGDHRVASQAMGRIDDDAISDGRVFFYVRHLLQFRVMDLAGGWPSVAQVDKAAALARSRLPSAWPADAFQVEDLLRTVFDRASAEEQVSRGRICVFGVMILGLLADDPQAELHALRPRLARVKKLHDERDARAGAEGRPLPRPGIFPRRPV